MTRWKAAGLHLTISLLVGTIAFCLLYFVYYPQPFFVAAGADVLVLILLGVDIALGPLLTLAVFKSGKWGMKFDLAVIALLQLGALAYGSYVMWTSRPVFIVAAVDRIEMVFANDLEPEDLAKAERPEFRRLPLFGPVYVDVRKAVGNETLELVDAAMAGKDIQRHPKYYIPWSAETVAKLKPREVSAKYLTQDQLAVINQVKINHQNTFVLPLQGRTDDFAAFLDNTTGHATVIARGSVW